MNTRDKVSALVLVAAIVFIAARLAIRPELAETELRQADAVGSASSPRALAPDVPQAWPRPLFSKGVPDGGPKADEQAAIKAKADTGPRLAGIILTSGRRTALIHLAGTTHRVGDGGTVGKWRVARIDPRAVLLEAGSSQQVLLLDPAK